MNQSRAHIVSFACTAIVLGVFVWLTTEYWGYRGEVLADRAAAELAAQQEDEYREAMLEEQLAQTERYVPPAPIIDPLF